jgi:hypothetical protein
VALSDALPGTGHAGSGGRHRRRCPDGVVRGPGGRRGTLAYTARTGCPAASTSWWPSRASPATRGASGHTRDAAPARRRDPRSRSPPPRPAARQPAPRLGVRAEGLWYRVRQLEFADVVNDPGEAPPRLTFVVVCGGYTGTEVAARLRHVRNSNRRWQADHVGHQCAGRRSGTGWRARMRSMMAEVDRSGTYPSVCTPPPRRRTKGASGTSSGG